MGVKIKVNGRSVPANRAGKAMGDAIEKAAFEQVRKNVRDRLSRMRCPEHHQAPQVTASGTSLSTLSWSIAGCCDRLIEEARRALR